MEYICVYIHTHTYCFSLHNGFLEVLAKIRLSNPLLFLEMCTSIKVLSISSSPIVSPRPSPSFFEILLKICPVANAFLICQSSISFYREELSIINISVYNFCEFSSTICFYFKVEYSVYFEYFILAYIRDYRSWLIFFHRYPHRFFST